MTSHIGDVGTILVCTIKENGVPLDVSTSTTKQFHIRRPDGTVITVTATFLTTGVDGKIRYVVVGTEFSMDGAYTIQGYIEMPTGKWHTDVAYFDVEENL